LEKLEMKKSLIALAVMAAAGAASAQSTVTLYGVADVNFGTATTGVGAAQLTQTKIDGGTINGNRWGLKGSEDLGGGLKANFQLESGFSIDTGAAAQGGLLFGRQAWVGVSGNFGAVSLGRQYTAYDAVRGTVDVNYDSGLSPVGTVFGYGAVADYSGRVNNSIAYKSPSMGGFSGALVYSLGAETSTVAASTGPNTSLNLQYGNGPLWVGYGYQREEIVAALNSTYFNVFGVSYNLGMATLRAGYNTASNGVNKDKEYLIGAEVPVGSAANVSFGYAKTTGEVNGVTTANGTGYGIVGTYNLSKRTALYAGWNKTAQDNNAGVDLSYSSVTQVGLRHKF